MEYRCERPGSSPDGSCGKPATRFFDGGTYHRPICDDCGKGMLDQLQPHIRLIKFVDPAKVPFLERRTESERRVPRRDPEPATTYTPVEPETLKAEVEMPAESVAEPMPSRPPLRAAFADLAVAVLRLAAKKVEEMR